MIEPFRLQRLGIFLPAIIVSLLMLCEQDGQAISSPYVTTQQNVALNQASTDTVNGVVPFFNSHTPLEGASVSTLTDATSADEPTGNVILGPDNTWVGVAYDFGEPPAGMMWRLDRFDAWIAGEDNLRRGYRGDLSISTNGSDFGVIPNSFHEADLSQNSLYNHVRYDFPSEFVDGQSDDRDKHVVKGFRYLRLNSRGATVNGADWQSRFVETDIWVTAIPAPSEAPTITGVAREGGAIRITWQSIAGRSYNVEYKAVIDANGWNLLNTVTAGGASTSVTDNSIGEAQRFYRVALQP